MRLDDTASQAWWPRKHRCCADPSTWSKRKRKTDLLEDDEALEAEGGAELTTHNGKVFGQDVELDNLVDVAGRTLVDFVEALLDVVDNLGWVLEDLGHVPGLNVIGLQDAYTNIDHNMTIFSLTSHTNAVGSYSRVISDYYNEPIASGVSSGVGAPSMLIIVFSVTSAHKYLRLSPTRMTLLSSGISS